VLVGSVSWTSGLLVPSVRSMNETRIVDLRTQMGWTQERLADESGVTVRTVQRLEAGNEGSLDTLSRVAEAFGVPVRDLFITVPTDDYGRSVTALDERASRQQERRGRVEEGSEPCTTGWVCSSRSPWSSQSPSTSCRTSRSS
jgi:transcriptional regulator with XRE-family HTH domain